MDPNYRYGLPENNTNFFFMGIIQYLKLVILLLF